MALAVTCSGAFLISAFIAGFVGFASSLERTEPVLLVQAEGVVALTGGSDRVLEAAEFLARGQARRLLITGVNRATHGADLEKILPVSRDLFACCVDLGYKAMDTAGNARETLEWARSRNIRGPLIVVTSNYHMPRAMVELSAALPGFTLYPFPVVSEHVNVRSWRDDSRVRALVAREYLKYLRAIVRTKWEGFAGGGDASGEGIEKPRFLF
ncbi:YdcF family protein [Methylocystis heyeri]|uniref:YdcF family protein n=1 Tax=Methylocystis heyeri TaxID=391905 RepID=A0A6B8KJU0_9HYPH|nr:YdcF family protein [Methylocystis heyeri]